MKDPGWRYFRLVGPALEAHQRWVETKNAYFATRERWLAEYSGGSKKYQRVRAFDTWVAAIGIPENGEIPYGWKKSPDYEGCMVPNKRTKLGRELDERMRKELTEPEPYEIYKIVEEAVGYDPFMTFYNGNHYRSMGFEMIDDVLYATVPVPANGKWNMEKGCHDEYVKMNNRPDALEELKRWEYFKIADKEEEAEAGELVKA